MVAVALLAGVSGTAWANGTEIPPPEPSPYTPPPAPVEAPAPAPAPVAKNTGWYISGAVGIGIPGSFQAECCSDGRPQYEDNYSNRESRPPHHDDHDDNCDFDLKNGLVLNGAIGYNFGSARLEGAVGYQKHDFSDVDQDISLLTVMANAYYDFDAGSGIKPYIMGGLGMANIDMSWTSENESVFAWQVGAGFGVEIAERTTLDLGYRYLKPNQFDTHSFLGDGDVDFHNIMLGLRYQF